MRVRVVPWVSMVERTKMEMFACLRGQNLMRRSAAGGDYLIGEYPNPPPAGTTPRHFPPGSVVERHVLREGGPKGVEPDRRARLF